MKPIPAPISDYRFCAGQDKDGSMVCAYRSGCKRFLRDGEHVRYEAFHLAGDDCAMYESKQA